MASGPAAAPAAAPAAPAAPAPAAPAAAPAMQCHYRGFRYRTKTVVDELTVTTAYYDCYLQKRLSLKA